MLFRVIKDRTTAKVIHFSPESAVTIHLLVAFIFFPHATPSKHLLVNTLKIKGIIRATFWLNGSWNIALLESAASSEAQGQLVGTWKSLNGRQKRSGGEKSRTRVRAP